MVGHQDVGVKPKTIALTIVLEPLKVGAAVLVVLKSSLPLIAADNHMIERPVKLNSRFARHAAKLPKGMAISQYSGLTPIISAYPDASDTNRTAG